MKLKKTIFCAVLFFVMGLYSLQAQETITSAGGEASSSGGSASYSVGLLIYKTHTGTNGSVAEGVQQPYEISVVSGIDETAINLEISAYPNPTTDFLTLSIDKSEFSDLTLQLYDMQGKLIQNKEIINSSTSISMSKLAPSVYILKIINDTKEIKSFNIIKK